MDFQRVSAKDVLIKMIPLHFINGEESPGFKEGGVVNHTMTQVEVRCQAQYLPEYIEVDLIDVGLDESLHLSDLKLPKHVELTVDLADSSHDHPIAGIHISRAALEEEALEAEEAAAAEALAAEEGTESVADESEGDEASAADDSEKANQDE